MMHTEDEARKRVCPYLPSDYEISERWGEHGQGEKQRNVIRFARCIASDCMAWRWTGETTEMGEMTDEQHQAWLARRLGYCGLAGDPQ